MFTDCCLLPSWNPLSDRTRPSHVFSAILWRRAGGRAHGHFLCPVPQLALCITNLSTLGGFIFCFPVFLSRLSGLVLHFSPLVPWYLDFLAKKTIKEGTEEPIEDTYPPPFPCLPCLPPGSGPIRGFNNHKYAEKKCLDSFLRPLWFGWVLFFSEKT